MIRGFKALDRVLRGDATRLPALRAGTIDVPARSVSRVLVLLGMVAGACTGIYAVITRHNMGGANTIMGWEQLLSSTIKVPLLFCLTLTITFPSLYVFNALVGSRLNILSMLRLLVAALAVMMAVLASLGPIVAFFAVSTTSYPFMKLLNVIAYSVAGILGLAFLLQTLHRLSIAMIEPPPPPPVPPEGAPGLTDEQIQELSRRYDGALDRLPPRQVDPRVRTIFRIWVIVFGLVGAQMSWVLRPFIGNPDQPFVWLRGRESHFFQGLADTLKHLFSW